MNERTEYIKNVKRIVVKVGTSTLAYSNGLLNFSHIESLVRQLADLHNRGYELILVSSGAIGAGMGKLGIKTRPKTIPEKQATAAVGQGILLHMYEKFFSEYGQTIAQILLTKEDADDKKRFINARNTFNNLLKKGVIPIVNENDAVAVDELKFGGNDNLSAVVSVITNSDLLVLLSDIDGLFNKDPRIDSSAEIISFIDNITDEIIKCAGGTGTALGTGGMISKIEAAQKAMKYGTSMIIANGAAPKILDKIMSGENVGTFFNAPLKESQK